MCRLRLALAALGLAGGGAPVTALCGPGPAHCPTHSEPGTAALRPRLYAGLPGVLSGRKAACGVGSRGRIPRGPGWPG